MQIQSIKRWLAVAAVLSCGLALAQAEPTLNQVYEAAHAGRVEQAQTMMQQVLVAHPGSAKAHFVQAELSAQQGQMARAREELATAEKLAPGLPFAKTDAVQNLRTQLAVKSNSAVTTSPGAPAMAPVSPASPFPWGLVLVVGGGVAALLIYLTRNKTPASTPVQPYAQAAYGQSNGLSGPQTFGAGAPVAPGYGPAYGQQPVGSGLGGRVMGGLATGLAVGAGVMAAQAIGKSLMGNDQHPAQSGAASNDYQPFAGNGDLGGQNFGVADSGSWDDGGGAVASNDDGGGDWDS